MKYSEWFERHGEKHRAIVNKLEARSFSKEAIIDYFDFDNMLIHENDFCELYKTGTKCHDMQELNCYLCACPLFRFNDESIRTRGQYLIKSECSYSNGTTCGHDNVVHQDCSDCSVPHHRSYVDKHFDSDWHKVMHACPAPDATL